MEKWEFDSFLCHGLLPWPLACHSGPLAEDNDLITFNQNEISAADLSRRLLYPANNKPVYPCLIRMPWDGTAQQLPGERYRTVSCYVHLNTSLYIIYLDLSHRYIHIRPLKSVFYSSMKSELISETVILCFSLPASVQHGRKESPQVSRIVLTVVRDAWHWDLKSQKLHSSQGKQMAFWSKTGQDLVTKKLNFCTIVWRCWSLVFLKAATQTENKRPWTFILESSLYETPDSAGPDAILNRVSTICLRKYLT